MEPLPPIPTPFQQRWREFRIQVLPLIVFACLVAAVAFLWKGYVQPVSVVGEVESVKANVTGIDDGLIVDLTVDRFDKVTAGQVVGTLAKADPETVQAGLAALKADLEVLRARMTIDDRRRELSYHSLRVDLMQQKIDLATARANEVSAQREFNRQRQLFESVPRLTTETDFDAAKAAMEAFQGEVQERTRTISDLASTLESLHGGGTELTDNTIARAIEAKEKELELTLTPVALKAPIDGVISMVYHRAGERVLAGEPILTVSATQADRIIGYLRMPISQVPEINAEVVVRVRGQKRMEDKGRVLEVGAQMEPINPVLISTDASRLELGLPVLISMPPGLRDQLRPGEVVDLSIQSTGEG